MQPSTYAGLFREKIISLVFITMNTNSISHSPLPLQLQEPLQKASIRHQLQRAEVVVVMKNENIFDVHSGILQLWRRRENMKGVVTLLLFDD